MHECFWCFAPNNFKAGRCEEEQIGGRSNCYLLFFLLNLRIPGNR